MSCSVCQESLSHDTQSSRASASSSSSSTPNTGCDGQSKVLALCCGHVYHQACICDWFKQSHKKTCPICRRTQKGTPLELFLHNDSSGDESQETARQLNDLLMENGKLCEKIKALEGCVSSTQEQNRRLEKKQEELQIRYSVREVEFLKEARGTAQLKSQLNAAKVLSSTWETRIGELDNALARKDAEIAQLQQSIQEMTQTNMGLANKLQSLQGQYSELSMKYTARDLEYIAEASKSQKLSQEAMAAIDRLTKLEHKIAEQSRVIAYREILIRQLKLQLQDSDCKSSCAETSSDDEVIEAKIHELREQYSELESKYVARYAAYKKEATRSRTLTTQFALANAVVAEQDQRIQELQTAASMRAAEMGLLQSTIDELVSTEELADAEQQLEAEQEISRDRDTLICQLDALSAKHKKHAMSLQAAVDRRRVATKDLKSRIHSLRADIERHRCCTCYQ